jgi:hypothetical protein
MDYLELGDVVPNSTAANNFQLSEGCAIRYNNTTSTLISSVANANATKLFSNNNINIAVTTGSYVEFELVCPAWATLPTLVRLAGVIYI